MKITLNVHPADGIQPHEEMYEEMAEAMGVDSKDKIPVICDPANSKFIEAYFKYLHHPREEEGVDFWWIDWQQGSNSKIEGLDPLWIFNHFHFLDSKRNGKRPMTFSRYAGPGSHRYPIGFSGDTVITWESLDFQPYFTETASNIGYGWWSHDIGGHMQGYKNDEMTARWTQLGIFSPIMRLHSTCSEFNGKEPWRFKKETEIAMGEALRLRHAMAPYLYTMNYRSYKDNLPLVLPMYYEYPEENKAYDLKNQFYFGTEMIVSPITQARLSDLNVAKVKVWLPEGIWYDIFTGLMYTGGRTLEMYRTLESIPVLAKAGGIIPFTDEVSGVQVASNPHSLKIFVFAGTNGKFELYEDDNETCDYEQGICVTTEMCYTEGKENVFSIYPAKGQLSLIPEKRTYTVEMTGYQKIALNNVKIFVDDALLVDTGISYDAKKQAMIINIPDVYVTKQIKIVVDSKYVVLSNQVERRFFDFLNQAEIEFSLKDAL